MGALPITNDFAAKVAPLNAESWQAWRLGERESLPIPLHAPATLNEAMAQALSATGWNAGDTLAVQYSHAGLRKFTLWQFTIRRSTRNGTWRAATDGGRRVFVGNLEPKLICETALASAFAPVLRFDAFRDDAVGRDLTLVDARS